MRTSRRFGSIASVLLLAAAAAVVSAAGNLSADEAQAGTDMWRRTAHGWERIDEMRAELEHYRTPDDFFLTDEQFRHSEPRWDFHPAWLAAVQAIAVAGAFAGRGAWADRSSRCANGGSIFLSAWIAETRAV